MSETADEPISLFDAFVQSTDPSWDLKPWMRSQSAMDWWVRINRHFHKMTGKRMLP